MKVYFDQIASISIFPLNFKEFLKSFLLLAVMVAVFVFQPVAFGQADILSNLTPEQLAQFNQLPPAQRQALLSQLQLGSSSGFESPVTQPETITPRGSQSGASRPLENLNQLQSDIDIRNAQRNNSQNDEETYRDRIKRKAQELFNLGIDLEELDVYGELEQMGIFSELQTPAQYALSQAAMRVALEEQEQEEEEQEQEQQAMMLQQLQSNTGAAPQSQLGFGFNENNENDGELRPFGYNLFAGSPSTFAPATDIPVPANYVVGPGDTVILQLYGQLNVRYELAVSREGIIQFPEIGPLNVSGLSFEEMSELIQTTVDNTLIGQEVSVSMGSLRSIRIFVLGEAYRPGVYTVSSLSTMTNALFYSGGVSNLGSLRSIQLLRDGDVVNELDLYDLLLRGDTSNDARLQPNDVIFINTVGNTVGVSGEVRRPALFELKDEENISDVLSLSGGLLATAYPQLAHLERINTLGQRTVLDLNLTEDESLLIPVSDGDLLYVDTVLDQIELGVSIEGHVNRPGNFAWTEGARISDLLRYEDFLPNPDFNYAVLLRELLPSRNIEVHQVKLGQALNMPGSLDDLLLQPRDRLLIFGENTLESRLDRRLLMHPVIQTLRYQSNSGNFRRVVRANGELRAPGEYPLTENMSIADLLNAAGGSSESADIEQAELSRSSNTPESGMITQNINLDLSNSLNLGSALEPLDQLTIRPLPNWGETETVRISGEVVSPGVYVIGKDESLGELIARAGGLTEYADPKAGIFLREELRVNEQRLLDDFNDRLTRDLLNQSLTRGGGQIQQPQVNVEVMNQLLDQIEAAVPTGRLVIDLPAIVSGLDLSKDVILRDGDELFVPRTRQEVGVIGEVQLPTSHLYAQGQSVSDYINLSGGFTRNADEDNIFIIKSNGAVIPFSQSQSLFAFANDSNSELEPGDSIVIPYYARLNNPLVTWMNISTVLFNLATTVLAIESVGN